MGFRLYCKLMHYALSRWCHVRRNVWLQLTEELKLLGFYVALLLVFDIFMFVLLLGDLNAVENYLSIKYGPEVSTILVPDALISVS